MSARIDYLTSGCLVPLAARSLVDALAALDKPSPDDELQSNAIVLARAEAVVDLPPSIGSALWKLTDAGLARVGEECGLGPIALDGGRRA
jgi:hypothetical protein